MSRYKISMQRAKNLQRWALKISGADKFLKDLPKLPNEKKIKSGLYVSYALDENELDDGLDWPAPVVANVYAVVNNSEPISLGEIRAYNWETFWLSTNIDEQVDTAENWRVLINKDYKELLKSTEVINENNKKYKI